jgi:hypothetical protein
VIKHDRARKSLAELGIVVVGVMIALAADSWREGWVESREESQYIERLREDVSSGLEVLHIERATYQNVMKACIALMEFVDDDEQSLDDAAIVDHLVEATQMGFGRNEMASDVTYREMVQSGRLNLIQDQDVREGVVTYYRDVELLIEALITMPLVNNWFAQQTGIYPIDVSRNDAKLSARDRDRLITAVRDDAEVIQNLRTLHGQIIFNDRLFERLITQAEALLLLLE